jgi:hypothetical protein
MCAVASAPGRPVPESECYVAMTGPRTRRPPPEGRSCWLSPGASGHNGAKSQISDKGNGRWTQM